MTETAATDGERFLAFLDLAAFDEGSSIRGGCLVTDGLTRPLEFRVSGPIRPTSLQRVLYGDLLMEYICTDLIGLPMLQTLELHPELVLVREAEFLKLRPRIEVPVLWARATPEGQFAGSAAWCRKSSAPSKREKGPLSSFAGRPSVG